MAPEFSLPPDAKARLEMLRQAQQQPAQQQPRSNPKDASNADIDEPRRRELNK